MVYGIVSCHVESLMKTTNLSQQEQEGWGEEKDPKRSYRTLLLGLHVCVSESLQQAAGVHPSGHHLLIQEVPDRCNISAAVMPLWFWPQRTRAARAIAFHSSYF